MKKYKGRILLAIAVIILLIFSFFAGTADKGEQPMSAPSQNASEEIGTTEADVSYSLQKPEDAPFPTATPEEKYQSDTPKEAVPTEAAPSAQPADADMVKPASPTATPASELTCTLSVRCDTAIKSSLLDTKKREILPENGVIFKEQAVTFYEGESVFNVLLREMKRNKIHMEYSNTPIYSSAYIEGIGNLYEFDCGELSGWMYRVNGSFPGYGCSRCYLKNGDKIEWIYTCDLGADIGGRNDLSNE